LLAQHDAVRSNKDRTERVIATRTRLARHVEGVAEMLLVVRLRGFDHVIDPFTVVLAPTEGIAGPPAAPSEPRSSRQSPRRMEKILTSSSTE
jgi:hypothetical protein